MTWREWFLNNHAQTYLENLQKYRLLGPTSKVPEFSDPAVQPNICLSNRFPDNADTTCSRGQILRTTQVRNTQKHEIVLSGRIPLCQISLSGHTHSYRDYFLY